MKDCFVLYYNQDSISVNEVYDIYKRLEEAKCMEGKTLIVLPDVVYLKNYSKEELVQLLKFYSNCIEELLNE
jgi:hypothetical protein